MVLCASKGAAMKVIRLPDASDERRLIVKFIGDSEIEIHGEAGSAEMALAAAVLLKLSVDSLEQ